MSSPDDLPLGRREAAERSRLLRVRDYDVTFDLSRFEREEVFGSRSTVRFGCVAPGAHTWIDLVADEVTTVELNGARLDPEQVVHGTRIMLAGLREDNTLTVTARHTSGGGRGLTRSVDPADGAAYAWTQFEPCDARRAYACFDQPDLKARFCFAATVPVGWRCVSNSQPTALVRQGETWCWSFAPTPVLPTYVTAMCAGPFHTVADAGQVPLAVHAPQSRSAALDRDAQDLLTLTRDGLAHFSEKFGASFAGDSYDCVFLPGQPGAMENYGCVTWNDSALPRSEPTADRRARRRFVLLHEMAHMWFGDLVSLSWWDGLWLKESFADWAGFWASAQLAGGESAWAQFLLTHKVRGYAADQSPTTHPIHREVSDVEVAEASFDMVTYAKGAGVLRQLAARVGDEAFLAGLRGYFARHAWRNADLPALLRAIGDATGEDLTGWADQWLAASGVNTLRIDAPVEGDRYRGVVIRQSGTPHRSHRMRVGCYDRDLEGRLTQRETLEIDVAGPTTPVPGLEGRRPCVLLPNDGDLTFAKVRCDERSLPGLIEGAHTLPSALSRAEIVVMVREMMLDGDVSAVVLTDLVARCLRGETDPIVVGHLATIGVEAATVYTATAQRDRTMSALAAAMLQARGLTGDPDRRGRLDLGFAEVATTKEQIVELTALLADSATPQATRWAVLTRMCALGLAGEQLIADEEARDGGPDSAAGGMAARAACPATSAKDTAFESLLRRDGMTTAERERLAAAFWQPGQEHLLRSYAEEYLLRLPDLAGADGGTLQGGLTRCTFPVYGVDDDFVGQCWAIAGDLEASLKSRHGILDQAHWLAVALRARRQTSGSISEDGSSG